MRSKTRVKKSYENVAFQTFIIIWVSVCTIFSLLGLFLTIINSLKTDTQILTSAYALPKFDTLIDSLIQNFSIALSSENSMLPYFVRSICLSIVGGLFNVTLGSILAYLFTYKDFYLKEVFFMMFISVMLLPSIMGMPILVPFMWQLNLQDSYVGYLLPNIAGGQVSALFLFRTFFGQQPKSIYESAKIDGATDAKILLAITLPLAFPIILFQFVTTFGSLYGDYLWPTLIMDKRQTLAPIMATLASKYKTANQSGAMYAMYIVSAIPLICTSIISMKFFSGGDFAAGMKL